MTVRVDRLEPMLLALRTGNVDYELLADGVISVPGRDTAEVGGIAAGAGVTVTELSRLSPVATLEAMFLAVTGSGG